MINAFEKKHHQHTLIIVNIDEIKDDYQIYKNHSSENGKQLSSQKDSSSPARV